MSLINAALKTYDLAWKAATPLLKLNHRLREGWDQRTLSGGLPAPADLWIQSASGGEGYLTWEVLKEMKPRAGGSLRILATTTTRQGFETLSRAAEDIGSQRSGLAVQPWYFPLDSPEVMNRVMAHVAPRAALVLETEIWPGFLDACRNNGVRVLLANGRMTTRSLAGYMTWPALFRSLAPELVMAVSETDARRFGTLFGRDRVWVMPNIKFDRMAGARAMKREDNPLRDFVPTRSEFVVFGSVRKQELAEVSRLAADLLRARRDAVIGLFPRHMHHVELWQKGLNEAGLTWTLRSKLRGQAAPGMVVIWDSFGELIPAYGLAQAAFVGGSLKPLGGQNFLEPLTCGVTPVTGPHWTNFAWVGREIIDSGLAMEGKDRQAVLDNLLVLLDNPRPRSDVTEQAKAYIRDRRGGAKAVAKQVADFLNND